MGVSVRRQRTRVFRSGDDGRSGATTTGLVAGMSATTWCGWSLRQKLMEICILDWPRATTSWGIFSNPYRSACLCDKSTSSEFYVALGVYGVGIIDHGKSPSQGMGCKCTIDDRMIRLQCSYQQMRSRKGFSRYVPLNKSHTMLVCFCLRSSNLAALGAPAQIYVLVLLSIAIPLTLSALAGEASR